MKLFFKKKSEQTSYDKENQIPVLHCSICNGEQVAGFKDIHTGKFEEVCLIRNDAELQAFKDKYGITEITKEY
ncbi:aspartate dehydrogenase [Butyrivibrio sp. INlla16]|uniref:aspartate dehydrogenase n=1 Tax=Butyrivibrio sp. INlla16 TaxID=1520807 RepID=UPI00088E65BC|nr:aspartate dehydrogenase [Butyrivibrio sp. INlla16]SDB50062.1 hypothetical protein SAMN02910263_02497 [Butyrivibrio sp. INlla16]